MVEEGYIKDDTPNLRNRPHTLRITGKLNEELEALSQIQEELKEDGLEVSIFEVLAYVKIIPMLRRLIESGDKQIDNTVKQDDDAIKPFDTHCKSALHEYTSNKELNRELNKQNYAFEFPKPNSQSETFAKAQVSSKEEGILSKEEIVNIFSEMENMYSAPSLAASAAYEEQDIE